MEPKIDIAMKAEKSKTCHSPLGPIRLRGIQLGSPRLTIEQKMKSTLEGILALALILHIFRWIPGAKLGGKIESRRYKKTASKMMKNEAQQMAQKRNQKS